MKKKQIKKVVKKTTTKKTATKKESTSSLFKKEALLMLSGKGLLPNFLLSFEKTFSFMLEGVRSDQAIFTVAPISGKKGELIFQVFITYKTDTGAFWKALNQGELYVSPKKSYFKYSREVPLNKIPGGVERIDIY